MPTRSPSVNGARPTLLSTHSGHLGVVAGKLAGIPPTAPNGPISA